MVLILFVILSIYLVDMIFKLSKVQRSKIGLELKEAKLDH